MWLETVVVLAPVTGEQQFCPAGLVLVSGHVIARQLGGWSDVLWAFWSAGH